LLCAGITVYNPLEQFDVKPHQRVGVIGIGGLGHLAIQFASAWGCEVTAFSTSPDKEGEARSFGAHRFVNLRESQALEPLSRSYDLLLSTVNVPLDWSGLLATLRPKGKLCLVGILTEPIGGIDSLSLIDAQRSLCGSTGGGTLAIERMLGFAARHRISPMIQQYSLSKVNEAMRVLADNQARYRLVLKVA
jgi:uncharacterized zinc-type alcohol dehydrogenase-like protein